MKFLDNISIKYKIISLILIVSIVTIGVGFTAIMLNDIRYLRRDVQVNSIINANLLGEFCVAPLMFDDKEGALEILNKIEKLPYAQSVAIYDQNNILFAKFNKDEVSVPTILTQTQIDEQAFQKDKIVIYRPINYRENKYGTIRFQLNTLLIKNKIRNHILLMMGILAGMLVLVFILANRFQNIISRPVLKLANHSMKIARDADYSLQIERETNDEIGILFDSFNEMVSQIKKREIARDRAERNLQEAKEKAEESDRLKSAFLANMSHEIRTPMNAILGFTELITMPNSKLNEEERRQYVSLIHNSGNNLLHLINDIIDISKLEAGQLKIIYKECNLKELFANLVSSYQEIKKQKGKSQLDIRINKTAETSNITIKTDPLRLQQVLSNLIDNALKFTDSGYIEFGYEITTSNQLEFYVKDTGIGIDPVQKENVFGRFMKLDEDKTKVYRGAGLGLAICKSIVELLNGRIWLESQKNRGSTFSFTLPFSQVAETTEHAPLIASSEYNWMDKTILIAEDEPANFFYIQEVLKKTNASVLKAQNGLEAVQVMQENEHVDLVIMDLKMPVMNGYDATKKIREFNKEVPIISQTAYAMNEEKENALKTGLNDYITKPIKPEKLLAILNKYINHMQS